MITRTDLSALRDPRELPAFWVAVVLNVLICVGAIAYAIRGGEWLLSVLPIAGNYSAQIRAIAIAAVLVPPLLVFTRNHRLARVRGDSIKVGPSQYPLIDERFRAQCEQLGVRDAPTLYVSDDAIDDPAHAFSTSRRTFIVLGTDYLEANLSPLQDVWSFLIARELGRLALGHTHWLNELAIAYVERLPWVHRPLRHVRAYSLDQIAAYLEPEGVRALIVQQSGRRVLPATNIAEQIRHAQVIGGFWVRVANLVDEQAHLAARIRNLYARGLFNLEHDLRRFADTDQQPGAGASAVSRN